MTVTTSKEFQEYKKELESRENYTFLTEMEKEDYQIMAQKPKKFSLTQAKSHPFLWMYHVIGVKPADYQFKMLQSMVDYGKVTVCTSRQIGKSTTVAGFAFWAAYNNMFPSGPYKDTKIIIVSQTEDQAKKLLREIDGMITLADERMSLYTKDSPRHDPNYFRSRLKGKPTQFEVKFPKGFVKVTPPTPKIRGNSADILIIDEAANLEHTDADYFYSAEAAPTTAATGGKIFLFSTPKGKSGFFHDFMNPDGNEAMEGWVRVWFPWTVMSKESALEHVWQERERYVQNGDEADFKQEYEASFMSGKNTYFKPDIIDKCVDENLEATISYDLPVTLGVDFGDTHSKTVVTAAYYDKKQNVTHILWYKEFPQDFNNADLPEFIDKLARNNYKVKQVVVDDCVGGKTAIELIKRKGFNVVPFQFTTYKQEYYEYLKNAFANKRISLYNDVKMIRQLKALESHETPSGNVQIKKPKGGSDDIADSIMLAASPYIKVRARNKWRIATVK